MSSKKKATNRARSSWVSFQLQKEKCSIFCQTKDVDSVKKVAGTGDNDSVSFTLTDFINQSTCPIIVNKVLFGDISKQVDKGVTKLPHFAKSDLIYLSPETMSVCGFSIGQPAVVSSAGPEANKTKSICLTWPVANYPPASVGVHDNLRKAHDWGEDVRLSVEAVSGIIAPAAATKVLIRSDQDISFADSSEFQNFATRALIGKHVLCGSLLSLSYYGKPLVLEVTEITAQNGVEPLQAENSVTDSDSAHPSESMCTPNQSASSSILNLSTQLERTNISTCSFTGADSSDLGSRAQFTSTSHECEASRSLAKSVDFSEAEKDPKSGLDVSAELENQLSSLSLSGNNSSIAFSTPKRATNSSQSFIGGKPSDCLSVSMFTADTGEMGVYRITKTTRVKIVTGAETESKQEEDQLVAKLGSRVTFDLIGGMERQLKSVKDMVQMPLKNPHVFDALGIPPPRGVLLYGPSGVGKTMLARAVAFETGVHTVVINGPEVLSKYYGESESRLRDAFQEAVQHAPSLILIDELDALCPRRERVSSELEKRVVSMLLTLMDGMGQGGSSGGHVLILGATSRPDSIDTALRRPGRFDREIEIGVPNARERRQILEILMAKISHSLSPDDVGDLADSAHGYVGADLAAVCKEAAMCGFERLQSGVLDITQDGLSNCCLQRADFQHALTQVKPSALREVEIDIPKVYWSDIGGQASTKLKLRQAVEWPIKHPEAFTRLGVTPPRGVLMYGPPGCSKTLIAKALATESGLNFISVKGPELFSKWVGDSERAVREVFRKARSAAPAIVFFDEIDGIAVERGSSSGGSNVGDRVLGQLLTELDGVESLTDVVVVAATNRPDMIDKALMRPGRLDRILYVSLPDDETRREIFNIQFQVKKMPVAKDCSLDWLVEETKGYSGAEVVGVCREAALAAMQESLDIEEIGRRHFIQALTSVQPQTTQDSIRFYEEYHKKSGLSTA